MSKIDLRSLLTNKLLPANDNATTKPAATSLPPPKPVKAVRTQVRMNRALRPRRRS